MSGRWLVAALFALLLVGGLMVALLLPTLDLLQRQQLVVLDGDPDCDPTAGACIAWGEGLSLALRLAHQPTPLAQFPVRVRLEGAAAAGVEQVAVVFTMTDMDMGLNRFGLRRGDDGVWRGQAMLPVCTDRRQDWRVQVRLAPGPMAASFGFRVEGQGGD